MSNDATPVDVVTTQADSVGPDAPVHVPVSVGRYTVERELGRGGMGTVYLGYDPQLDRNVAIKLLHRAEGSQQRLLREARAVAKIRHPHVVGVYDVGECTHSDGAISVFMVMEYVEGVSMGAWMETVSDQPEVILAAFLQAGAGLCAAHERGIIHRDFKPLNVLIGTDGAAKVLDFGLARAAVGEATPTAMDTSVTSSGLPLDATLTEVGSVLGTPRYMSPEQHRGQELDARTDQYSFCLALLMGLGGAYPFPTDSASAMVRAKVRGGVSVEGVAVPRRVAEALRRGLEGAPSRRWPTMTELLVELRPRPRRWPLWVAASIAIVGTPLSLSQTTPRLADPCAVQRGFADDVWGSQPRADVEAALATSAPGVAATETVVAEIDRRAAALANARVTMCEAQLPPEQESPRLTCLEELKDEMSGVVARIGEADHHETVPDLLALLGSPSACDPSGEGVVVRTPAGLRDRLFQLRVLLVEHEYAAALPAYEALLEEARGAGAEPFVAEVLVVGATLHSRRGDLKLQLEAASEALQFAERAGRDALAVEALLTRAAALKDGTPEQAKQARRDLDLATAKLPRLGDGYVQLHARVAYVDAAVCQREQFEGRATAQLCVERAEEAAEAAAAATFSARVVAATMLANAHLVAGSPDQANAALDSAIDIATAAVGRDHPVLTMPVRLRGRIAARSGAAEQAEADFARALDLVEAFEGADAARASPIRMERAQLRVRVGRFDAALEDYRALARFGKPQYRLRASESLAATALMAGEFEAALGAADETLALEASAERRDPRLAAELLSLRAEALLRLDRLEEGLVASTNALAALEAAPNARARVKLQAKIGHVWGLRRAGATQAALRVLEEAERLADTIPPESVSGLLLRLQLERGVLEGDVEAIEATAAELRKDPTAANMVRDAQQALDELERAGR